MPKPSSTVTDIIKAAAETKEVKSYEDGYSKGKKDWTIMIRRLWIIGEGEVSPDELLLIRVICFSCRNDLLIATRAQLFQQ